MLPLVNIMRWDSTVTRNKRLHANVCTLTKFLAVLVLATGISAASGIVTIETTQLVNGTAWECAPVWDTDGGKLFYASNESGNFDIRRIDAGGANKTQITDDPADEFPSCIWGGKVVYVSQSGGSDIWIMDADGTNRSELSGDGYDIDPALVQVPVPWIFDMQPSGTLDNNVPAISANFSCSYGNISTVNLSVNRIDVTPTTNITDSSVSYVPTEPLDCGDHNFAVEVKSDWYTVGYGYGGFTITYITNHEPRWICNNRPTIGANISVGYGDVETVTIYVDCVDVTADATITESYISYTPIEPLLNGMHNATVSVNSTYGINDSMNWVFSVDAGHGGGGGSDGVSGTYPPGWFSQPKIVFASNRSGNFDLWIMNTDGTGVMRLTDSLSNETHPAAVYSKIVYVSDESGNCDLWSMDIDGSNRQQLTASAADEYMPAESPIGGIVYASRSESGDDYDLWAMNTDGTGKTRLTNNPSDESSPAFSSSLHQLKVAYVIESDDSDIRTTSFEETKDDTVRIWRLGAGRVLVCTVGTSGHGTTIALLDLNINGTRHEVVVAINESFSIPAQDNPRITGTLHNISRFGDSAFEASLVNVTHYSTDGVVIFSNRTKTLISAPIHLNMMRGDLDGDGKITPTDAVIALDLAVTGEWCGDADMNDDARVTALDAFMILQAAVRNVGKP